MEQRYLTAAQYIDSDHPTIQEYAKESLAANATRTAQAVHLYYRVRDEIRYTPYLDYANPEMYRASSVLANGFGFCISKASLLAACGQTPEPTVGPTIAPTSPH